MNKKPFLFPAFVLKYIGNEVKLIENQGINLDKRLLHLSELTSVDVKSFDPEKNNFMDDELKNQLITYLLSCTYSDILKSRAVSPSIITSLSMGIYSALYCAGSISFNDGAILIKRIYKLLDSQVRDKNYKMLAITGLSFNDITKIIDKEKLNLEIVIKNNQYSFIITGPKQEIHQFHEIAISEGAIHLNIFPVSIPYHSKFFNTAGFSEQVFNEIEINMPAFPVFSSVNQRIIHQSDEIKAEIIDNLSTFIDWHKTMATLIKDGLTEFIECGPGDSLKRISRFLEEPCKVIPLSKIIQANQKV